MVLLIIKSNKMTQEEQNELDALNAKREQSYEEIRKELNRHHLVGFYQRLLDEEENDIIKQRYYRDMLSAFLIDDDNKHDQVRKETNRFWNQLQIKQEVYDNKIEYLKETVEYLRELVVEVGDPSTNLSRKFKIVREVNNKDFYKAVRPRIKKRVEQNLKY